LPHERLRSGGVPEPEGPASLEGSASGGPGAVREGVGGSPRCQRSLGSAPWTNGDERRPVYHRRPNGVGDHRDLSLVVFIFSISFP
jgi:hypothetical protein